nr:hypothetical protein [uncultured Desulfobacter sp.]
MPTHKTWLLFEDGSSYSIVCDIWPEKSANAPHADAYIVTDHSEDFLIAAKRAVNKVHLYCNKARMNPGKIIADFDLSERVGHQGNLAGQSCGLSFAAAFARKMLDRDLPELAATGEVCSDGRIGGIKGIKTKIETSITLLKEDDYLFFPKDNLGDIPKTTLDRVNKKGIKWFAVSNVDEFMQILSGNKPREKSKIKKIILSLAILFVATAVALAVARYKNVFQAPPPPKNKPLLVPPPPKKPVEPKTLKIFD